MLTIRSQRGFVPPFHFLASLLLATKWVSLRYDVYQTAGYADNLTYGCIADVSLNVSVSHSNLLQLFLGSFSRNSQTTANFAVNLQNDFYIVNLQGFFIALRPALFMYAAVGIDSTAPQLFGDMRNKTGSSS